MTQQPNTIKRLLQFTTKLTIIMTILVFVSLFVADILEDKHVFPYATIAWGMRFILWFSVLVALSEVIIGWIAITGGKVRFRNRDIWMWVLAHLYLLFTAVSIKMASVAWNGILG